MAPSRDDSYTERKRIPAARRAEAEELLLRAVECMGTMLLKKRRKLFPYQVELLFAELITILELLNDMKETK